MRAKRERARQSISLAAVTLAALCACGGRTTPHNSVVVAEAAEFPAVRFVPDKPTYVVAAHSVRDAQRALTDVIESFGMIGGVTTSEVEHELQQLLNIDPLAADIGTKLGVDLGGGFVMFSEALDPTFVVHLSAPETAQTFFEHLRELGVATQSVIVEGIEINTAKVVGSLRASWAIDKDWLWVHFAADDAKRDPTQPAPWFVHARHAATATWTKPFEWAKQLASKTSGLIGFLDVHALIDAAKLPSQALACVSRLDGIGLAGFAIEGDGHHAGGKLGLAIGGRAQDLARAIIAPPAGFQPLADTAPLAAQWNLDVGAVLHWVEPCLATLRIDTGELGKLGVRTGRVALETLDPDDKSGTGVVALDLTSKAYFATLLDKVPRRSMFESDRTFGAFKGHRIKVPFFITLDYVLDDQHAFAAMGDGMLDKLVMGAPPPAQAMPNAPIFALDVRPPSLKPEAWQWLVALVSGERFAKSAVERLMRWHDGHLVISLDRDTLVIDAEGNRR